MKDLIPTVKITNYAGVSSIKDGMKSNAYSKVEREKKPSWIRMTANQANQNYSLIKNKVKNLNQRKIRRGKFKSLVIEKDFEPENPKQLEELDENSCKWPIGHPNEKNFYFCGRTSLKDFSYCKLHLLYAFQPKNKKEEVVEKDSEVPKFIQKKIKSA